MARPHDNSLPPAGAVAHGHGHSHRRAAGYGAFPTTDRLNDALPPAPPTKQTTRAVAPDLLRGLLMLTMALDHTALALNTWEHGTGRNMEMDGVVIDGWNRPVAFVVRTLTHLCAPGFTFLLGVGVVYLGRSRTRMGWSTMRIAKYFAVRGFVLTMINVVLGLLVSGGQVWLMNFVLFSLAVDYFLAGMLWLLVDKTEPWLARVISARLKDDSADDDEDEDVEEPLLRPWGEVEPCVSARATNLSWHVHNAILLVLGVVSIWWNIWLSPTHGHCQLQSDHGTNLNTASNAGPDINSPAMSDNALLGIWFWIVQTDRVMSVFPPMAWLSFAILGLLYARIDLARPWSRRAILLGHSLVGLFFMLVFVLTRVLRFGNLSEDCLHTPEHVQHPDQNPYLVSVQSFLYIIKYPPDVAFWAFTLAGNFFLLALFAGIPTHVASRFTMLLDFGRAALFFYIAHLFMVFLFGGVLIAWLGHDVGIPNPNNPDTSRGIDNAWAYFAIWGILMLSMWPIVRWYGRFKATKPADSIWRFF
ncbi:hypothetical protein B0T10DRAFT_52795 [Thelonectria olida]|uniref:Heparan-alpha-glucosaminide N-acetyltransferase catalytic domain-containing protein n=1 Tax=Thelonectria olida TaxID=1576542 RepID=A0A9P8W544_9HYPO|nr:hypothetical protein B0T10DRAFT_52795 [Thelonectria olida]